MFGCAFRCAAVVVASVLLRSIVLCDDFFWITCFRFEAWHQKRDICMTTALPAQAPTMENMYWCQHDPHVVHRQWTAGFIIFHYTVASSRTCKPRRQGQPMQGSKKIKLVARLRPAPPTPPIWENHTCAARA